MLPAGPMPRLRVTPLSSPRSARGTVAGLGGAPAPVDDPEVVAPVARRAGELPEALERVVAQRRGVALGERRVVVARDAQHAVVERDPVRPAHATRVEVLHDQPVADLGRAD